MVCKKEDGIWKWGRGDWMKHNVRWLEEEFRRREKGHPNLQHTLTHARISWRVPATPILNITPKHAPISPSAASPYSCVPLVSEQSLPPTSTPHPTCSEARWHTWLWDFVVLYLMMNYASAAVTLKNAITTVIRQMGLFCLAYAVHLLGVGV